LTVTGAVLLLRVLLLVDSGLLSGLLLLLLVSLLPLTVRRAKHAKLLCLDALMSSGCFGRAIPTS
jgi:hypothetical protein